MSLFKAREWWSCQVGTNEQFDYGCLKVGSFHNDPHEKIIVGSHAGILRIFSPTGSESDGGQSGRPTDLLLEKNFGTPIIQVEVGRFITGSDENQIAILFANKLSIFDYYDKMGMTEHGRQIGLELNYEHNLNRPTFNMCKGQFGGGRNGKDSENADYLCVQTLDGVLFVFEHERQSMAKSLPDTYLPGPIAYLSRLDAVLTVSSNYHLECYKYQALAISSGAESSTNANSELRKKGADEDGLLSLSQSSSKRVSPEWIFNLGESALAIQVTARTRNSIQMILILGERNLFCLHENGQLISMTKFEYNPSTLLLYTVDNQTNAPPADSQNPNVRYIIGTHSHTLFICQDTHIRWAAHVEAIPVQIELCNLQGIRGMLCMLSETGFLQCCYLGTDPVSASIPTVVPGTTINIQEAEEQLGKLNKRIKDAMNDPTLIVRRKANEQVIIQIEDTNQYSMTNEIQFRSSELESNVPSLTVKIRVKSSEAIQNVLLTVNVYSPLCAQPNEIRLGYVAGGPTVGTGVVSFWMRDDLTPWNLEATFTVSYNTVSDNASHAVQKSFRLPLKLVARGIQQVNSSNNTGRCKITIGTNRPVVDLNHLFPELLTIESSQQHNIVARFYGSTEDVSILASSKSQKYRFQSDSLASIWLFCQLLVERLTMTSSIDFEFGESLPYQDYFRLIDRHFECRVECEQINATLDICSKQFRAVQKRLLSKFKDKTPTLLDHLDSLLESTSQQIFALADRYEERRYDLDRCSHDLSCATKLLCLLLKLSVNLSDENSRLLNSILSPVTSNDHEQGWEETVETAVTYALRTTLARSKSIDLGSTSGTMGNSTINVDISRLKKRIQTLCERLEKGGSLVSSDSDSRSHRKSTADSSYASTSLSSLKEKVPLSVHRETDENEETLDGDRDQPFAFLPSNNLGRLGRDDDD